MKYNYSEFLESEWELLKSHIEKYKPKKILEIGVSYGGTTNLLLSILDDTQELFSIDISTDKRIASVVNKKNNWTFFQGDILIKFDELIKTKFDLVILDTAHVMPGEILDFLMVYPLMNLNSYLALHDISLFTIKETESDSIAPFLLLNSLSNNEKTFANSERVFSNFTIIKITKTENIFSIFNLLCIDWKDYKQIKDINSLNNYFKKYYSEDITNFFKKIYKYQLDKRIKLAIKDKLGNK